MIDTYKLNSKHNTFILKTYGADNSAKVKVIQSTDINNKIKAILKDNPLIDLVCSYFIKDFDIFRSMPLDTWYDLKYETSLINQITKQAMKGGGIFELK
jgi:hypothetical protein